MARIKIELPEKFTFKTQIPVRITDLNYGGHVGNDSILSLIHESRVQFIKSLGFTEKNFGGVGLIMADTGIEYVNESFYGDIIQISITISEIKRVSFDIFYLFEVIGGNGERKIITKAKTGMVCFDYNQRKVVRIPEETLKLII